MAGDFYTANMLAEYSLNLLRGQMITQLVSGQGLPGTGGLSLTEFILGKPKEKRRSGTDMMNDALSGLMRSDAAMLRQASKNMLQGKALLGTGNEAIKSMQEKAQRMGDILSEMQSSGLGNSALEAEYASLSSDIKGIIEGTKFNGISLFDGSAWQNDERVSTDGSGVGKISLQAGNSTTELTLYDLGNYKDPAIFDINGQNTASALEQFKRMLSGMGSSYTARAGLLDSEAASFERQAEILDEATGKAKPGDEEGLKEALVDILMRDKGSLVSEAS